MDEKRFWNYLHEKLGRCGHCGNKKCEGRKAHSILPDKIPVGDVVAAVAFAKESGETHA